MADHTTQFAHRKSQKSPVDIDARDQGPRRSRWGWSGPQFDKGSVYVMTLKISARKHRLLPLVSVIAVVALAAITFAAPAAQAGEWSGSNPAYTWTTGNGAYYTYTSETADVTGETFNKICVSPVQWNGSKYVFPWGWQCKLYGVSFTHEAIYAAHGVYNPEGHRVYFVAFFS
jgi:hypothetical protein